MIKPENYQDIILDHYHNPRCKGDLPQPSASATVSNPLCGDEVFVAIAVSQNITEIRFRAKGCSISQASASIASELCMGKSISEATELSASFSRLMSGQSEPEQVASLLGDAIALEGISKFPLRVRCALLPWQAIERCLEAVTGSP